MEIERFLLEILKEQNKCLSKFHIFTIIFQIFEIYRFKQYVQRTCIRIRNQNFQLFFDKNDINEFDKNVR